MSAPEKEVWREISVTKDPMGEAVKLVAALRVELQAARGRERILVKECGELRAALQDAREALREVALLTSNAHSVKRTQQAHNVARAVLVEGAPSETLHIHGCTLPGDHEGDCNLGDAGASGGEGS